MNDTRLDKNKPYTFVFRSTYAGTSSARQEINVDWSIMPDQPYMLYWSYVGEANNVDGLRVPSIFASFMNSIYQARPPTERTTAIQTQLLGLLRYDFIGNNSFIYADYKTNPPVYLPSRPMSNLWRYDITENAIQPVGLTYFPSANDLSPCVLTLLFVPANQE